MSYQNLKAFYENAPTNLDVKDSISFEGNVLDGIYSKFKVIEPTSNNIITFPDASIEVNKVENLSGSILPSTIQQNITAIGTQSQNINLNNHDLTNANNIYTNSIYEKTVNSGVLIDTILLKDFTVYTNIITESVPDQGVTIENNLLKDGIIKTNTILEKITDQGVTIEGILLKDYKLTAIQSNDQQPGIVVSDTSSGLPSTRKIGLSGGTNVNSSDNFHAGLVAQSSLQTNFWTPIIDANCSSSSDCTSVNLKCKSVVSSSDTSVTTVVNYTPSNFTIYNNLTTKGVSKNVITITSSYTVLSTDHVILTNSTGTITLPSPANTTQGRELVIKNINNSNLSITIESSGSTIEGSLYYILDPPNSITIISDSNKDWWII